MYVSQDEAIETAFSVSSLLFVDDELESFDDPNDLRLILRLADSVDVLLTNGSYGARPDISFRSCIDADGELKTEPAVTSVSESESENG